MTLTPHIVIIKNSFILASVQHRAEIVTTKILMDANDYMNNCDHSDDHTDKENMAKRVTKSPNQGRVLKSHKDTTIEKMKQEYHRRHYHPNGQHRSNLEIVANILELALTEVGR